MFVSYLFKNTLFSHDRAHFSLFYGKFIVCLLFQENFDDIDDEEGGSGEPNKTGMVAKLIDTKKKRQTVASGRLQLLL